MSGARHGRRRAANQSAALLARSTSDKMPPQAQEESAKGALTSVRLRHHIDGPASVDCSWGPRSTIGPQRSPVAWLGHTLDV